MTPELLLSAVINDIYIQITITEGEINHCLATGDIVGANLKMSGLMDIARQMGADMSKYPMYEKEE